MKYPPYDTKAPKQTVSLTLNSDLYSQAKKLGINSSQVAEEALNVAVTARLTEQLKAEILQDLAAYNTYVAEHGSPAELARVHYASDDDAI
jgi:post-segregation antitoxin (ccd killing protein)